MPLVNLLVMTIPIGAAHIIMAAIAHPLSLSF
jgi:hypothetical protein